MLFPFSYHSINFNFGWKVNVVKIGKYDTSLGSISYFFLDICNMGLGVGLSVVLEPRQVYPCDSENEKPLTKHVLYGEWEDSSSERGNPIAPNDT